MPWDRAPRPALCPVQERMGGPSRTLHSALPSPEVTQHSEPHLDAGMVRNVAGLSAQGEESGSLGQCTRAEMCRLHDVVGAEKQRDNRLQGGRADGQRVS